MDILNDNIINNVSFNDNNIKNVVELVRHGHKFDDVVGVKNNVVKVENGLIHEYIVEVYSVDSDDDGYGYNYNLYMYRAELTVEMVVVHDGHTFVCDNKKHNFYAVFSPLYPQMGYNCKVDYNYGDSGMWWKGESDLTSILGWKYMHGYYTSK